MQKRIYQTQLSGTNLTLETGELAQFANGAVLVRYGDTVVLTTVTASSQPREGIDFFPLSVDYEEKMYSVGKIPGGFLKREGRPTENAVLTARSIDRPIRPLFPDDLRNDVVVNNLILSVDHDHSPQVAALIGTSAAISISDIPWRGPVAGVQLAIVDDKVIVNPDLEAYKASDLDLFLAGTHDKICMIEAGANEVTDEKVMEAIEEGHKVIQELCQLIQTMQSEIGKEKFTYESKKASAEVLEAVRDRYREDMRQAVLSADKSVRDKAVGELADQVKAFIEDNYADYSGQTSQVMDELEMGVVRDYLLNEERRVDGRGLHEIRALSAQLDLLPRVHGSALFTRGQTQVLTICTLGTVDDAQRLDGVDTRESKRYMHQYNFPAYSVGEARPNRSPGRREIGHGALAERALIPVLPDMDEFPYAIRCVSEVTMSNGSTSQASVCSSSLALMAAGVPIKKAVAGISSGLIIDPDNEDRYLVFMDIQGIEDFFGDMDFKVAGTNDGITAIQVDIKVDGLSLDIVRDAFAMTKKGRMQILDEAMNPVIAEPRAELSPFAPKIDQIDIPSDKIRDVIGTGGKVIRRIVELTETQIDVEEDGPIGHVYVASTDTEAREKAIAIIKAIVFDPEPGTVFDGTVTRLMTFGAFVEIAPGKEGLVHISKMAWERVNTVEDVLAVGDPVKVVVSEIDDQGRLNLSMRDLMEKPEGYVEREDEGSGGRGGRRSDGGRSGGRDFRRNDRGGRDGGRDSGRSSYRGGGRDGGRDSSRDSNRDRAPRRDNDDRGGRRGDPRKERSF
ncbi:MAG: polyribonucleotide nucleotidyltransferase [Clostridiaceae bacterium]|nr:polyribonucleotide nucleotidyltransferase [Clostridiaceae bacterium]